MGPALVVRISEAFNAIAAMPNVAEAVFRQQAGRIVGGTTAACAAQLRREHATWAPVIREAGIRAE